MREHTGGCNAVIILPCLLPGEFDTFADMWWFPHAATIAFFFSFGGVRSRTTLATGAHCALLM